VPAGPRQDGGKELRRLSPLVELLVENAGAPVLDLEPACDDLAAAFLGEALDLRVVERASSSTARVGRGAVPPGKGVGVLGVRTRISR